MRQEIRLLGEVQVFDGRRSHHPPVDKRLGLLGYLACKAGDWVEREKVAFLFWPDVDDGRARKNLRSLVARCRNLPFAGTLEADPHRLRWPIYSDVAALREALARGAWHEVIELYRGDLLGDATLEDSTEFNAWLDAERHEMRRSYRSAVLGWALERHAAGAGAEAVELLEDLLAHDPIDEEAAQVALSIVANVGRGEVAARLYRNLDLALQASVGVGPSEATKRLLAEASAAAGDHKRRAQPAGALRPPRPLTSFIGREADLARIADLLEDPECRLVSIVGPGGVGKTRLALRAAEVLGDRYEHGAPFVPLETVTDPQRVPAQVARALDLRLTAGPDAAGQVIEAIGDKRMLLVVDNIEQALAAVGFFERLLERCANVDVIMTTRERPGSTAEWLVPIQGLSVPPSDASPAAMATFDAVRLFVERARQVVPEFALDDDAARHVVRIADLTEGLPLALELAAVWLRVLSPEEVVTEIERNLGMLVSENRSGPSRHRSIRATFDHSWSQLSAREKQVLRRLASFSGGFRREAASRVADATIPLLASLVDKSLLKVDQSGRYDLHPLLQQFLAEKLAENPGEDTDTRARHACYYADLAEESERQEGTRNAESWKGRITAEYPNLCVAMEWAEAADDAELGLRLIAALSWYWGAKGIASEPLAWLRRMVAIPGSTGSPALGRALHMAGWKSALLGDAEAGREHCRAALDVAEETADYKASLDVRATLADIDFFCGHYAAATDAADELVRLAREAGDESVVVLRLMSRGLYALLTNDLDTARARYEEAVDLAKRSGVPVHPIALCRLGTALSALGEREKASDYLGAGLLSARESEKAYFVASCSMLNAALETDMGDVQAAAAHIAEALTSIGDSGDIWHVGIPVHEAGVLEASRGRAESAARLWGAVHSAFEAHGFELPPYHCHRQSRWERPARGAIGSMAFESALAEGRSAGLWRVVENARMASAGL